MVKKRSYLLLQKSEWDRLNRKNLVEEDENDRRDEYFRKLVEKSQSWIKTWSDTVQGHVEKVSRENEKKRKQNIAFLKSLSKENKKENPQPKIENAKRIIFQNSCYGRKLVSALVESKIFEERKLQIQFQAKLQEESKTREQKELAKLKLYNNESYIREDETSMKRKQLAKEISEINQCMYRLKITEDVKQKTELQKEERECAQLTQQLLENEAKQQREYEEKAMQNIKEYEKQQKDWRERKKEREKFDTALADAKRVEQEKRKCKIQHVLQEIHRDKRDTEQARKHYELVNKIQSDEKARYDRFLEAGIKRHEDKSSNIDKEEILNEKMKRKKCYDIAQENKRMVQMQQLCPCRIANQCVCERQTLFCNSNGALKKSTYKRTYAKKSPYSFLCPSKKLLEEVKLREQEPSPWSGLNGAHATFAKHAAETLKECRYKIFARKVVDEYRKNNSLNARDLPVDNYF